MTTALSVTWLLLVRKLSNTGNMAETTHSTSLKNKNMLHSDFVTTSWPDNLHHCALGNNNLVYQTAQQRSMHHDKLSLNVDTLAWPKYVRDGERLIDSHHEHASDFDADVCGSHHSTGNLPMAHFGVGRNPLSGIGQTHCQWAVMSAATDYPEGRCGCHDLDILCVAPSVC